MYTIHFYLDWIIFSASIFLLSKNIFIIIETAIVLDIKSVRKAENKALAEILPPDKHLRGLMNIHENYSRFKSLF